MKFAIRDLLWLTLVVAVALGLGVAWWGDHANQRQRFDEAFNAVLQENMRLRTLLRENAIALPEPPKHTPPP